MDCEFFEHIRNSTGLVKSNDCQITLRDTDPEVLGKYLMEAFMARKDYLEGRIVEINALNDQRGAEWGL